MATSTEARAHPHAVFYGDSIVTGWRGTSSPRARWPTRVCDELGWRETSLALDGMGYVRRRGPRDATGEPTPSAWDTTLLDAVVRLAPAVVVVCLGANDIGFVATRSEEIRTSMRRDLARLATELPGTAVVVTTYFPRVELPEPMARIESWVVAACRDLDLTHLAAFREVVAGDPALLCDDRIHPNDAGHAALAAAVVPVLRALVPGR